MKDFQKRDLKRAKGTQKGQKGLKPGLFILFLISGNPDKNKKANSQNACFRDSATMGFFAANMFKL